MKSDRYAYQQARKSGIGVQIYVGTNRFALLKGEAHRVYSPFRLSTPASSQVQGTLWIWTTSNVFSEHSLTKVCSECLYITQLYYTRGRGAH
mgnify:CR=1 FL=1